MSQFSSESSSSVAVTEIDVIIVGAGLSGLTSAYKLLKKDPSLRIYVIEARESVGGRIQKATLKVSKDKTETFDIGSQWISSSQTHILKLIDELELDTYPQYAHGSKLYQNGSVITTYDKFPIFNTWYSNYELKKFIAKIETLCKAINLKEPMASIWSKDLDTMTLDTFFKQNLRTKSAIDFMRSQIQIIFGTEASSISALFFMAHANGTCGFFNQFQTSLYGSRELKIQGGANQIINTLLNNISENVVKLDDPVVRVEQLDDRIFVTTMKQKVYRCEYVIMAIPPPEISRITFEPPLPLECKTIIDHLPTGHQISFIATYPKAFWRDNGFSGEFVNGESSDHLTFPIRSTFDAATATGYPALVGYLVQGIENSWEKKTFQERQNAVLDHLKEIFGPLAARPLQYYEKNWSKEHYIGGCPSHFVTPGAMPSLKHIRVPFQRIYWAGTETATSWYGFMNGAVQAGCRAAIEVLYELRPQVISASDLEEMHVHVLWPRQRSEELHVFRWTVWLPLAIIGAGYFAYKLRNKYSLLGTGRII